MPQDYRSRDRDERYDEERRSRMRWGDDRDAYESGNERRYLSGWDERAQGRGFEGERSYPRGGYAEEVGFKRDRPPHEDERRRAPQRAQRNRPGPYTQFGATNWSDDPEGAEYFGAGSHYGGGFGTAPGSRASSAGSWGAPGYGGQGAWSDRNEDWRSTRGTSGSVENFGRSEWGAQSGYGRDYGRSEGSHRGRGPKGYQRSDARLRELICERLTDDPRIDASDINIEVNQGAVKLTGSVEDRRTKHEVEDLIEDCGGVQNIDNQLRVNSRLSTAATRSQRRE